MTHDKVCFTLKTQLYYLQNETRIAVINLQRNHVSILQNLNNIFKKSVFIFTFIISWGKFISTPTL